MYNTKEMDMIFSQNIKHCSLVDKADVKCVYVGKYRFQCTRAICAVEKKRKRKNNDKKEKRKKNREKGAKRKRERGENRERRNFGTRNWRQSVGWLNRGVEGREPLYAHEEEGPGAPSPHTTLLHGTSEFSSAFVLSPFFSFFFFFFSALLLFSILSIFFPLAVGVLLRTSAMVYALLSDNVKTQQPM